jgi:CRISPR-associated protein Csh1
MLPAVKALGDYACKSASLSAESMFIESSKLDNVKSVLCINFERRQDKVFYKNIFLKAFNQKDSINYLYRIYRHQRYDVTPTSRIAIPEKMRQRFELWFKSVRSDYLEDQLLASLKEEFLGKIERIFNDFEKEYSALAQDERKSTIVTITIEEDRIKHIGDFEIFKSILKNEGRKGFYSKHHVEAKGEGVCSICKKKTEVMGFASPFSVYTLDKSGFAPNFLREEAWKRLPICVDCAIALSAGKDFLNKYLYKNIYGLKFYLLPHFVFEFNDEVMDEIKSPKKSYKKLLCREDDISETMTYQKEQVNLMFIFTKPKQSDYFDIMRCVEDVPPSWIRKIFKTREQLIYPSESHYPIFQEPFLKILFNQKWVGDFDKNPDQDTSLGKLVREFFPSSKYDGIYDKYFADILSDILAQRKIRSNILINAFSRTIRNSFIRKKYYSTKVLSLKSLMLLLLIAKLGILDEGDNQEMNVPSEDDRFSQFFKEYQNAFNTSSKRAVFLEGVLVKYLLDIQFAKLESTPFRDKLFGLRLGERRVKKLLPEIIQKLREYKTAYTHLEKATAQMFIDAENRGWNLTNEETSYFFILGMTLAPTFKVNEEKVDE